MSKLRIAIVAPSLGILGGEAVQADRLLRAWQDDSDIDACLVPINPAPGGSLGRLRQIKYVRAFVSELIYLPLLARQLLRADVVHVFSRSYMGFLLAPLPAIMLARAFGRPAIVHCHNGEAPDHLKRSQIARAVLARADRLVVPSSYLRDVLGQFAFDVEIVPNIIELDRFKFRVRDPLRPRILSTRNLHRLYNVACTLRAFRLIQRRRPDAMLTVAGSGSDEQALRGLSRKLRLEHVRFIGRVEPDEMARLYADHDIYIQSPDVDNVPNSVIEAFASGLPVVSTDAGGVPTIIKHGEHGLLAPINAHEGLAHHVLRLLDDPELVRRLTCLAQATCQAYTWGAVREDWLGLYRRVFAESAIRAEAQAFHQKRPGISWLRHFR
jgi:glycosyltransferase involved in cell wall biosynthesis